MEVKELKLAGLKLITPKVFSDERGFFFESYRKSTYDPEGISSFVQVNVSFSKKNTLRGLHFQSDPGQAKLVSCLQGEIWDVAVDIRENSPTYMQWETVSLDGKKLTQLYIPVGFAHGFCVLSDTALVQYKVDAPYNPNTEKSIRWNDPDLNISWPIENPILSMRDQNTPFFKEIEDVVDYR